MGLSTICNVLWPEMNSEATAELKGLLLSQMTWLKPKISTPVSDSVECQDQNTFQLLYVLLEDAKGQLCTLASAAWGWWWELSSAQYWQCSSRMHFVAKGMISPHDIVSLPQCFWWLQAVKIVQICSFVSFWWFLSHEQTHSGHSLTYKKRQLILWVLARGHLKFRVCWEDPYRHWKPIQGLVLFQTWCSACVLRKNSLYSFK